MIWIFLKLLVRISLWNILRNSHRATFDNFGGGHVLRPAAFRLRFRQDLGSYSNCYRRERLVRLSLRGFHCYYL